MTKMANIPHAMSSAVDSATSTTTSGLYLSRNRLVIVPDPSFIGSAGSVPAARNDGSTPDITIIVAATTSTNANTRQLGVGAMSPICGTYGVTKCGRMWSDQNVSSTPSAEPPAT